MPFTFATATQIVVGCGEVARLPELVAGLGSRPLVCTGATVERHEHLLSGLGGSTTFQVSGEPTFEMGTEAAGAARSAGGRSGEGRPLTRLHPLRLATAEGDDPLAAQPAICSA